MDAGDVWRVTATLIGPQLQAIQNVWHIQMGGIGTQSDAVATDDIVAAIDGLYKDIESFFHVGVLPNEIGLFDVTNNQPKDSASWDTFVGGTATGEEEPPGCCALVVFRTGFNRKIGRKYIGVLGDGATDGGQVEAGSLLLLADWAGVVVTDFIAPSLETYRWGLWTNTGTFLNFTEGIVRPQIAYQRRRKSGVGI